MNGEVPDSVDELEGRCHEPPLLTSWLASGICAGLMAAIGGLANMPPPPRPVTTVIMFLILGLLVTGMFTVLSGAGGGG